MAEHEWVPAGVDVATPSAARLYDYYLGGSYNFAADRNLAQRIFEVFPEMPYLARVNRAFLRRTVQHLIAQGVRQFIDVGCGLPTGGAVHELAQHAALDARVVYVDNEPVAVSHSEIMLKDVANTAVLQADLTEPNTIFDAPATRKLLDFNEPIAVLLVAVMHFVGDEHDPAGILAAYRDRMPPESYLVLSHVSGDTLPNVARAAELYRNSQNPAHLRSHTDIAAMLSEFDLLDPGLVFVPEWQPEVAEDAVDAHECSFYGAVGRV